MDEPQKYYVDLKEPDTKEYITSDSTYMKGILMSDNRN